MLFLESLRETVSSRESRRLEVGRLEGWKVAFLSLIFFVIDE